MGFLNKLFGKTAQDAPEHSNTPVADLLTAYAGMALDKQSCLMDVLDAGGSWNVDLNMGELYFDGETGIAIQAIGSFSYESESWLWAWANEASALPEKVLGDAQRLREYGEQHGIAWLLEASFAATTQQLHEIAAAAVGICAADAYYLGDYGQGILLMTLRDLRLHHAHTSSPHSRTLTIIPQMVSLFTLPNHLAAVTHYLSAKGYRINTEGNTLTAERTDGCLNAYFDDQSRLSNVKSTLQPQNSNAS